MALETVAGLVRSRLLANVPGLAHGFTTRHLGSMAGSIHPCGEQAKNRAALERLIGMPTAKPSQVHGNDVALVKDGQVRRLRDGVSVSLEMAGNLEADGLLTRERGIALAVAVADCVPVLLLTPDGWVGVAHAGWEGTTRGVVATLVGELVRQGARYGGREWRAVIGPSIGPCCYDIGPERAETVRSRLGRRADRLLLPRAERFSFDLWLAVRLELRDAGIDAVDEMDVCTKHSVTSFFSHRGEQARAGRGFAFIGWEGPPLERAGREEGRQR